MEIEKKSLIKSKECGFGMIGYCCSHCIIGPCRLNPFSKQTEKTKCGFSADQVTTSHLLNCMLVEAGAFIKEPSDLGEIHPLIKSSAFNADSNVELISCTLEWMGNGVNSKVETGLKLLLGLSLLIIQNLARLDVQPFYERADFYLLKLEADPREEELIQSVRDSGQRIIQVGSLDHVMDLPKKTRKNPVLILQGCQFIRSLGIMLGLAACGFIVYATLPYSIRANRSLAGLLTHILAQDCNGMLLDLSDQTQLGEKTKPEAGF